MAPNPPQTLSVKRKRNDAPVDQLRVGEQQNSIKRQKSELFAWRLVPRAGSVQSPSSFPSPKPLSQSQPQYTFSNTPGSRVLVQNRHQHKDATTNGTDGQSSLHAEAPAAVSIADPDTPRPRKRPGAGAALHSMKPAVAENKGPGTEPSEEEVRQFEQFSAEVEEDEWAKSRPPATPLKFQPRVPALRYKDRHPEKAAALSEHDTDAMDIDDYVIDTYVREVVLPDADGKIPEPQGTVGIIVLNEEDEEFWNGQDDSDREFATDDEDENAEEYYANDYPEDEMSSDDEFDRNLYKPNYRKGSDDEEYDLNASSDDDVAVRSDGDEDDEHFRRIAPPTAPGYWGRPGE
jgi:hypothetical protein